MIVVALAFAVVFGTVTIIAGALVFALMTAEMNDQGGDWQD